MRRALRNACPFVGKNPLNEAQPALNEWFGLLASIEHYFRIAGHSPGTRKVDGLLSLQCSMSGLVIRARDLSPRSFQAQLNPFRWSGKIRILLPVAAKMALLTAGKVGGSVGSPRPVGA